MKRSASLLILVLIAAIVTLGPLVVQADPLLTHPEIQLHPPDDQHLLGTDLLGRDVFSRVVYGGRATLMVAVLSAFCAVSVGLPLGWAAGAGPPVLNRALMAVVNTLLSIPGLVISLVILTVIGRGSGPLIVALGLSQIAPYAYVTRTAVRSISASGYVEASRGLGTTQWQMFWYHILPNAQPVLLAYAGVVFSYVLLNGAALSFLGLGNQPGQPDWGVMLAEGRAAFRSAPWLGLAPGVALTLTVWAANSLADTLGAYPSGR